MIKQFEVKRFLAILLLGLLIFSVFTPIVSFATADPPAEPPVVTSKSNDVFKGFDVTMSAKDMKIASEANDNAWGTLIDKYKNFITGVAAVGAVTMVVLFIMNFLKLGASAGNPQARSQALVGCLWTGIAAAGLGAVAIITGIFYNAVE